MFGLEAEVVWLIVKVVVCGVTLGLFLGLSFRNTILKQLALHVFASLNKFRRPFSPNWVTAYGILITLAGLVVYYYDPVIGVTMVIIGAVLDRVDGKIASVMKNTLSHPDTWVIGWQHVVYAEVTNADGRKETKEVGRAYNWWGKFWIEFNYPGGTDFGKVFDPMGDKIKILAVMTYFAYADILNPWLVALMFIPEVFGTMLRRPFNFFAKWQQEAKATAVGKFKVLLQWVCVILCIPFDHKDLVGDIWTGTYYWLPNFLLVLSLIFGIMSILSRLRFLRQHKEVDEIIRTLGETTKHETLE